MIFDPSPGPQGPGSKKLPLRAPFMTLTHTPNFVEFRPMVKEESITDGQKDRRMDGGNNIPFAFFKKWWG